MKKRTIVVALLIMLMTSILVLTTRATTSSLPDDELHDEFNEGWGLATVTVTDIAGIGVRFDYTGLTSAGTAKCDGYPVSQKAGGDPDGHSTYGNFTKYSHYSLIFKNVGTNGVTVNLFMNTGYTGSDPTKDSYWECDWVTINAGETKMVTLNFSWAKVYDGGSDPDYGHYPDGTYMAIYRLNEVSKIGFQVLGSGAGSIIVSQSTRLYFDPASVEKQYTDVGYTFDVEMKIEEVTNLYGFDIKITWDEALITRSAAVYNTYLDAIWGSGQWDAYLTTSGPGYYWFVAVSTQNTFNNTGSQSLLKLTFTVKDPLTNSLTGTPLHFDIHQLSDKDANEITNVAEDGAYSILGKKPTLSMDPTSKTCRMYGELFDISLVITDAASVKDFQFEIHYNTTLLDFNQTTWNAWGSGTSTLDEGNGIVTGSTNGDAMNGSLTLVTIRFKAAYYHIWKNIAGWVNDQTGTISFQSATLSYPSPQPSLTYTRGGLEQISVGPDVAYTFSPIKGDVDNNGRVTITDLRTIGLLWYQTNPTYNLVGADDTVNLFDLVIVSSNMWYVYP
jgi:hypothetical protein